jgi:hypothetical protein
MAKTIRKFISSAIKRPGSLTKRAEKNKNTVDEQAKEDIKKGTPLQKKQANFYFKVLKKVKR